MEEKDLVLGKRCKIFKPSGNIGYSETVNSRYGRHYSQTKRYKGTPISSVCGINYDQDEKKLEIEIKHVLNLEKLRREVGKEGISVLKKFVECPICLQIPNLERAVKICCGNKIWCLDGILESMKNNPSCPLGRGEITTEFFSKVEMANFIVEAFQSEPGEVGSLKGKDHSKQLTCFCNHGDGFIGLRGIIEQHNGHDIIEIEAKYSIVTKKIQEEAQSLKRNLGIADDLHNDIFDKGEKEKEMLISGLEPLLSLITENFQNYHQKSWGWFIHYIPSLDRIKEYQNTKSKPNKDLVAQGLMSNVLRLYSSQKELEKLNMALSEYQQNFKLLSESSPFDVEKYSFEFKIDKPVENITVDEACKGISGKLGIEEETVTIEVQETKIKEKAKVNQEKIKEHQDNEIAKSNEDMDKDNQEQSNEQKGEDSEESVQEIEIEAEQDEDELENEYVATGESESAEESIAEDEIKQLLEDQLVEMDEEKVVKLREELNEEAQNKEEEIKQISQDTNKNIHIPMHYLLFKGNEFDLFGTLKDPITAHTFLGPISLSTPLCLPLASLLPDPLPSSSTIKILLYEYSAELGSYLSSSLNGVAESMQEGLKKTKEKLEMLDKVNFSVE